MWRYLKAALTASVEIPLVGPLPLNLMAIAAFGLFGVVHPAFWLIGLGLETAYLYLIASNGRFQKWVDARDLEQRRPPRSSRSAITPVLDELVADLADDDRKRLLALKKVHNRILRLYQKFRVEEFTLRNNRDALSALYNHFARLLAAKGSILVHWSADPDGLQRQITQIESDLASRQWSPELRASRMQTLEILRTRLLNQERKDAILAEIDSELQRIEQQFDLALENAAIGSKPMALMADTMFDPVPYDASFAVNGESLTDLPLSTPSWRGRASEQEK